MSKHQKLLWEFQHGTRLFTWPELVTLLAGMGYRQLEGSGSRVKFHNGNPLAMISLHRPHPGNDIKPYIRRQIAQQLRAGGLIT
jgi:hypothetical protein